MRTKSRIQKRAGEILEDVINVSRGCQPKEGAGLSTKSDECHCDPFFTSDDLLIIRSAACTKNAGGPCTDCKHDAEPITRSQRGFRPTPVYSTKTNKIHIEKGILVLSVSSAAT